MKYLLVVACALASQLSFAGSVYKCESSNGIVYQSSPCAAGAKKLATACVKSDSYYSSNRSNTSVKFDGEDCTTKYVKEKAKSDALLANIEAELEAKLPPAVGMTKAQAEKSRWGYPDKVNTTTSKYSVSEQWVYRNKGYLYFDNGLLTSIQENN